MCGRERHLAVLRVVLRTPGLMAEPTQEMSFDLSGKAELLWCERKSEGLCPQTLTASLSSIRKDGCLQKYKEMGVCMQGDSLRLKQLQGGTKQMLVISAAAGR